MSKLPDSITWSDSVKTLLEQTDIRSMRFDLVDGQEQLTFARRPLLGLHPRGSSRLPTR